MAAFVTELDLCGLKCPLPVLRTRRALRRLAAGDSLLVRCTDPLAVIDIPHLARSEGHALRAQTVDAGIASFLIVKAGSLGARSRNVADFSDKIRRRNNKSE